MLDKRLICHVKYPDSWLALLANNRFLRVSPRNDSYGYERDDDVVVVVVTS